MPTGYTSIIDDDHGVSFERFVWRCARAFGALVMMRDSSMDAQVPEEFQPSEYYRASLTEAEAKLRAASEMAVESAAVAMAEENRRIEVENSRHRKEHAELSAAYGRMRRQVAEWKPPASHVGLQTFMLEQLSTGGPYGEPYQQKPFAGTAEEWLAARLLKAQEDVTYRREELRKEEERTRERNEWLRQLRASVPQPKAGEP